MMGIFESSSKDKALVKSTLNRKMYEPWTQEKQEELDKLIQERIGKAKQEQLDMFMDQPAAIRELVLERLRHDTADKIFNTLKCGVATSLSYREQTLLTLYYETHGYWPPSYTDPMPPTYKELEELHVDKTAREVLLEDK